MNPNSTTITWEDPPSAGVKGSRVPLPQVAAIADELRTRPGEWAHILTFPDAQKQAYWFVRDVRGGSITALKGAEVSARTVDGDGRVYARFPATDDTTATQGLDAPFDIDELASMVLAKLLRALGGDQS